MLKVAFMFVVPGSSPETDKSVVTNSAIEVTTIGVNDYAQAEVVAK